MADVNYPDVLGAITGGVRASLDMLQLAAAVRPKLPRAGMPCEMVLILQNACDSPVDVGVELALPELDAHKQRGRFECDPPRVRLLLQPAEAGVVIFPIKIRSDAAPSADYRTRMTFDARVSGKPHRIRLPQGGGAFDIRDLPTGSAPWFSALKPLVYSTARLHGRSFELTWSLSPGQSPTAPLDSRDAQYYSLWRATTAVQASTVLHLYTPLLRGQILSQLKRAQTMAPLTRATAATFEKAGFPLDDTEATLIAKTMSLILEYASPDDTHHGYIAAGRWAVTPLLGRALDLENPPAVPHWLRALLRLVEKEPRAASHAPAVLAGPAYLDLLYDAVQFGFDTVQTATGEDVGSAEERDAYANDLIGLLRGGGQADFSRAYLPLVMNGILNNDQLLMPQERPSDLLHGLAAVLERRETRIGPDEQTVYEMTLALLDRMAQKYGFRVLP